jgi:uncharacterized protein with von Willebrand factor type A (vWA) domain
LQRVHDMVKELEGYTATIDGAGNLHRITKIIHIALHIQKLGTLCRLLEKWLERVGQRELAKRGIAEIDIRQTGPLDELMRKARSHGGDPRNN